MRNALVLLSLFVASASYADIAPHPDRRRPESSAPAPKPSPAPSAKACGTGAAMVLAGIAAYGVWRLAKAPATEVAA